MPIRIEAYTLGGVVTGLLSWPGHLKDALETTPELLVERASFVPLDGRPASPTGDLPLVVDDVVLAVPDESMSGPVHAAWHAIHLEAGPYSIAGELATMPGFDPGRALARPTGTFVLLRDVTLSLLDRPDAGSVPHAQGLVNRYTVDAVEADLMLGFFFPGARIAVDETGTTVVAAGADAATTPGEPAAAATPAPGEVQPAAGQPAPTTADPPSAPTPTA
jgi:hypothetical protein